jgi:hypothetical protein
MKVILDFSIPMEPFNTMVKNGTAGQQVQKVFGAIKPESLYFTARGGTRGGIAIVDLPDASKIPSLAEPLFLTFNATVQIFPCMTSDDLAKGGLDDLGKTFG